MVSTTKQDAGLDIARRHNKDSQMHRPVNVITVKKYKKIQQKTEYLHKHLYPLNKEELNILNNYDLEY